MAATTPERYVVASCHVERPLDDRVWDAFAALQRRRPGGLEIAALLRPPDPAAGEADEERWLVRARAAAERGPLGHHCHWTSPTHARPAAGGDDPAARVHAEGRWLRERHITATLFCGGGWYTDEAVAAVCADLGYADCTPRATRPSYLEPDGAWAQLSAPGQVALPTGQQLVCLPTTHSAGDAVRAAARRSLPARVHVYFHDTDLVDRRRRLVVESALRLVTTRRATRSLDDEAAELGASGTEIAWEAVARG
ncbi:MAG: hypothetical protein ACRC50_08545, partial [Gaiella sp.]